MDRRILEWLCCADCGSAPLRLDSADADEVVSGSLACESCGTRFTIEGGIPFLLPTHLRDSVGRRASSAPLEEFGEYQTEATPAVAGLLRELVRTSDVTLDLGSGRGPYLPVLKGDVICVDIFPHFLKDLPRRTRTARVHPICASATHVPIREGVADLVFASELIEHLRPDDARLALERWPALARRWCVIDTPNGHEGSLLTRVRHLVYRTKTLTKVVHPELPELDHHSTFSPPDFRAAGYACHGCIGWVSRKRFRAGRLWDVYDAIAWRVPAIAGTLVAVSPGRAT